MLLEALSTAYHVVRCEGEGELQGSLLGLLVLILRADVLLHTESVEPAALDAGTVVSIACTARLSSIGAEVGVATVPASRGRGFAAAATVEWASLPSLEGHVLFYSTNAENISSQRVADRLELQFVGPSLSIR